MISSQRFIIMILLINIVIGLGITMANDESYSSESIDNDIIRFSEYGETMNSDDPYSASTNDNYQTESSIGNSLTWGKIILDVLKNGLHPFPFSSDDFDTQTEKIAVTLLTLLRTIMYILVILEIYFIIKNNKTT